MRQFLIGGTLLLISTTISAITKTGVHLSFNKDIANGQFKICFIGDAGDGSLNQYMVARGLADEGCHQVRHLGDIVYGSGINSTRSVKTYTRFLWPYKRVFKSKNNPSIFLSIGNHDYKKNPYAWVDLSKKHSQVVMPSLYYTDFWKDICFFTLDTMDNGQFQTDWFEYKKAESKKNCSFTIAMAHHPYLTSGRSAPRGDRILWYQDHIVGKVDMYFAGHDHHVGYEGEVENTRFFVSGAGGHGLRPVANTRSEGFAISEFGYITLVFDRLDDGRVEATYSLYTVKRRRKWFQLFKKGGVIRTLRHHGKMIGKGIRD